MKIVLIGAGSRDFGRGQIADLLQSAVLRGRGITLSLVDQDEDALARALGLAEAIAKHVGSDVKLSASRDRVTELGGASFVIVSVARRRMELWEQDFRVPLALGFRHCLGENGGPGALFHALRSLELVMPIARDVERLCPDALLLNFTNPESRVLHAISHLSAVNAIGICHGIYRAVRLFEHILDRPASELAITSAGMNHLYQVTSVVDRKTGAELRPEIKRRLLDDPTIGAPPLFLDLLEVFDLLSYPSDDHIGEYLRFGTEHMLGAGHGVAWKYGLESRPVRLGQVEQLATIAAKVAETDAIAEVAAGKRPPDATVLAPSGEHTLPIVEGMLTGEARELLAVNVLNRDGLIDNLPRDAVVEVPATVDGDGVHPTAVGPLPEAIAALMRPQYDIHRLLTEAYRTGSRELLLQCLLLDPLVDSIGRARQLLDTMLELQRDFLPAQLRG